jgi:hypothetical protein
MKRLFAILLSAIMILALPACTPAPEPEFTLGTVNGSVYENTFIGIGCNLGSEWSYYSDEQIREQNNAAANLAGDDYKNMLLNATIVYDMFAVHSNQISTIVVNLEKLSSIQLAALNYESYFEDAVPSIKQSLGNMGFVNITHSIGSVKIGETDFTCLDVVSELGEFKMYQTVLAIKCNGYLACVTFSGDSAESIASALECFYLIP